MAVTIRAGFFWVQSDQDPSEIERLCRTYASAESEDAFEVDVDFKEYRLTDAAWRSASRTLTGTMWRVRASQLPSKLRAGQASALEIASDESLGEPASFAYMPSRRIALIEYNHTGPRHCLLRDFLYNASLNPPVSLSPVLETDAVERMHNAPLVRRIEFALANPDAAELAVLRKVGGPVNEALDAMADIGGMTVSVTISMGHHRGGLSEKAEDFLEALASGGSRIQTLKASVKENVEQATEMLDLLGGRTTVDLQIPEKDREIDHAECRRRLLAQLRSFEP